MMVLFNQMADEIERLVEQLRATEKHRLQLLQELAHDLRTPVASLSNLLETLKFDDAKLEAKSRTELTGLAYQETEYLTRLVEDLLFLALVIEPKYKAETGEVVVQELLKAQIDAAATAHPNVKSEYGANIAEKRCRLPGNAHLLQRLFRNALENAYSFARSEVKTELSGGNGMCHVTISDDGPGLSLEELENFGKKRSTRHQTLRGGRISVGLGSVIIQAIASAHGGSVQIRNLTDPRGSVSGAALTISIPLGDQPAV
jgi:K+-sensing histidine kinase KdpD